MLPSIHCVFVKPVSFFTKWCSSVQGPFQHWHFLVWCCSDHITASLSWINWSLKEEVWIDCWEQAGGKVHMATWMNDHISGLTLSLWNAVLLRAISSGLNECLQQHITLQVNQRPSHRPVSLSGRGLFYGFFLAAVNTVEAHHNPSTDQEWKKTLHHQEQQAEFNLMHN